MKAQGTSTAPDWTKYRNATDLLIQDLVRAGFDTKDLIESMKARELQWIENHNKHTTNKIPDTWLTN
jgi:hypothetical protein